MRQLTFQVPDNGKEWLLVESAAFWKIIENWNSATAPQGQLLYIEPRPQPPQAKTRGRRQTSEVSR